MVFLLFLLMKNLQELKMKLLLLMIKEDFLRKKLIVKYIYIYFHIFIKFTLEMLRDADEFAE